MSVVDPAGRRGWAGREPVDEVGFDPVRERAIGRLAWEALERTRAMRLEVIDAEELIAAGRGVSDQPLETIGRPALMDLAGKALFLASGGQPEPTDVPRWVRHVTLAQASGEEALPAGIMPHAWDAAVIAGFRIPALHTLQAITVAWPPPGAARVWHPPRERTVEQVRAAAARALGGSGHFELREVVAPAGRADPADDPELVTLPEDLLQEALGAYMAIGSEGIDRSIGQIVRCCAEINRMLDADDERCQLHRVVVEAAEVIDGAGFAGGATASLGRLVKRVLAALTCVPGELGRYARGSGTSGALGTAYWPACAMRTGLIALWLLEQRPRRLRA